MSDKNKRKAKSRHKTTGVARTIVRWFIYLTVPVIVAGVLTVVYFSETLPTLDQISSREIVQSTKIYDRTGSVLLYEINSGEERTVVPLSDIPQYLKDATIAIEDENFYNEPAFDWQAILRAFLVNIMKGKIVQGGSTITQQLARNAFLTPERTISRKIKELLLAVRLNSHYSKDKILELYLNEIPYGSTLYGVEAASEAYFSKSAKELTLAESAILAAIPKAPPYYSPWGNHLKELIGRQKFILSKMFALQKITKGEMDEALGQKLSFAPPSHGIKAPHFVMAVQDYLMQKYGEDLVRRGGLRVVTTLDWNLEQAAEKAVEDGAAQNEKLYEGKNAALVAEDPKTGQILALVGSRDYFDTENEGNFNVATQGLRQPGSALKPFVYMTAFQKGYTPETVVFDVPTEFAAQNPLCPPIPDFTNGNSECFHPENFDGKFRGPVTLRQALSQSINIPSVKMLYLAGLSDSVRNAYDMGLTTLTSPDLYGLSLVLGGGAVKLADLVGAYSTLAEDGVKHEQTMVLEVRDANGKILESYADRNSKVIDAQPVRLVNNILSDAEARRGLFQSSWDLTVFPDHDVALKTGTSNDYRDAWAMGYTPSLTVGVWAGNNDNSPMQRHGSSILAAVPIWHSFMAEAIKNLPAETFNRPDPPTPGKPIFAGDYLYQKQIHSILYYVNKKDPTGPAPSNPSDDSQFENWETGVLAWAAVNLSDFKDYNQPVVSGATTTVASAGSVTGDKPSPPDVQIKKPAPGTFIGGAVDIAAKITSQSSLTKLRIYWNSKEIQEFSFNPGTTDYDFLWSFPPQTTGPQNLLELEAVNQANLSNRAAVIVYGK